MKTANDYIPSAVFREFADRFPDRVLNVLEPLAPYTTFRIGGEADLFFEARTAAELASIIIWARSHDIAFFLLGCGANIVFGDKGFRGLVVHNAANHSFIDGARLTAASGAIVYPDVIELAIANNLSGLEHYVGIPSTIGGALWQNLHFLSPAPDRERTMFIAEVLESAEVLTASGEIKKVDNDYFDFGYDYSILHDNSDVVLSATFQLVPGNRETMRRIVQENLEWRSSRHPPLVAEPSVGSIFKKIEGIGAGRLIDRAGLKGTRIGGVEITHRHANIFVNRGGGSAADVQSLIRLVQQRVLEHSGYSLETEISFVGEFAEVEPAKPVRYDMNGVEIKE